MRLLVLAGAMGLALNVLLAVGAPSPVLADCDAPPPIEQAIPSAKSAFVGTVTAVTNGARWATVSVEEVWQGPDLPPVVEVRGGSDPERISSVDRSYAVGTRYLFVVFVEGGRLEDNACSPTTPWIPDLAVHRPADARVSQGSAEPEPGGFDVGPVVLPLAGVAIVAITLFGAVALAARRRP